ncbi:MAG: GNAT family N-acetyltransferase [Anaerolineae bacterium]|nr:GNAT family N-acetyltransferase [Anaerolineae bacterium]
MSACLAGPAYRVVTPRLVLRCWQPADAPLLKVAVDISIEHLRPWMPWAANEPTDLDAKIALLRRWRGQFDLGQDFVYGIFNRTETEVLGSTGLHTRAGPAAREIGYWVRADRLNRGIATEAAAALTRVAFEVEGVDRVEIHCDAENVRSAAVPRKLGFMHEATLRKRRFGDKLRDTMVWTLFADEYPASAAARVPIAAFDVIGRQIWQGGVSGSEAAQTPPSL